MISYIRIYARGTFSYPYSYHIIFTPSVLPLRRNDSVHFHVHTEDILNQCNIEIIRAHILHAYPYQGRAYHYCIGYSADNESLRLSQLQNPSCSLCPSSSRPCRMLHVACCSSTIVHTHDHMSLSTRNRSWLFSHTPNQISLVHFWFDID